MCKRTYLAAVAGVVASSLGGLQPAKAQQSVAPEPRRIENLVEIQGAIADPFLARSLSSQPGSMRRLATMSPRDVREEVETLRRKAWGEVLQEVDPATYADRLPEEARDESRSAEARSCGEAVGRLRGGKLDPTRYDLERLVAMYDKACLLSANEIPQNLVDAGVGKAMGVLAIQEIPVCGGLRISSNLVLTAKHCLYDKDTGHALGRRLRFFPIGEGESSVEVLEELSSSWFSGSVPTDEISHRSDFTFLRTEPVASAPPIRFANASPGVALLLAGYFTPTAISDRLAPDASPWRERLRLSEMSACKVRVVTRDGCIYHGCQSHPSFSGMPLLQRSSTNEIQVVGLHLSAASNSGSCLSAPADTDGNIGVWVSPAEVESAIAAEAPLHALKEM